MPAKAPSIGATYGTGPDATEQMLAIVRQASTKQAARQAGPERSGPVLASNPSPVPTQAAPGGTLAGFDTCAAPSLPKVGGMFLNIDADWVASAVARK